TDPGARDSKGMSSGEMGVKVGVVGLGIGEQHARAFLAEDPACLRWIYDRDAEKVRRIIQELGTARAAERFEEIVQDRETNVVSIASHDDAHCAQVVAALKTGKHVFVEKPLCRSSEELQSIRRAWQEGGTP